MSHLSTEQITKLRSMLEEKLAKLHGFKTSVIEENPVNNPDRVEENEVGDDAVEEYSILNAQALEGASGDMIDELEAALARIEDGSYGLDEATGEPIPYERLLVMPEARTGAR
jgi:RNA polymerase-binding transcription factor DksA